MLEKNTASGIKMFNPDNKVEHYLGDADLLRLLHVLRNGTKRNFMVRMVALFLLSTGARLNEALNARWKDIDRENRVWRIPASASKSKKVRSVPLNDSAIEMLDLLGTEGKREWLFVSVTGGRLKYVYGVWERLRVKAGLPHLRLHDLRHQHASFLVNQGHSLYVVQQILGHNDPSVTQRYAHLSTKSLQDASDSASKMIQGAMKKTAWGYGQVGGRDAAFRISFTMVTGRVGANLPFRWTLGRASLYSNRAYRYWELWPQYPVDVNVFRYAQSCVIHLA